jgi:hypothetical protein
MSCCGDRRKQLGVARLSHVAPDPASAPGPRLPVVPPAVVFRYVGAGSLTVRGPITRQRYTFDGPGARVAVDGRDAPALHAVPALTRARDA